MHQDSVIYDISSTVGSGMAVWPGDTPFSREMTARISRGDSVNLSRMELSLHTGTHMDAPYHYMDEGCAIDEVSLQRCMGPALVVSFPDVRELQASQLEEVIRKRPLRVLFRFGSSSPDQFDPDFTYFTEAAAELLGEIGVQLVGTNSPSVDAFDSKSLPAHRAFGRAGIVILEGLILDEVPEGEYELIALPLKIQDGDGSPVRAVLRKNPDRY